MNINKGTVANEKLVMKLNGAFAKRDIVGLTAASKENSAPGLQANTIKVPTVADTPRAAAIGVRISNKKTVRARAASPTSTGFILDNYSAAAACGAFCNSRQILNTSSNEKTMNPKQNTVFAGQVGISSSPSRYAPELNS